MDPVFRRQSSDKDPKDKRYRNFSPGKIAPPLFPSANPWLTLVHAGIAQSVGQGFLGFGVFARPSDNHPEFSFVINLVTPKKTREHYGSPGFWMEVAAFMKIIGCLGISRPISFA